MDRKMTMLGDEELNAVAGGNLPMLPPLPSISVVASPITVAQAVVNTATLVGGDFAAQAVNQAGANVSNVSIGH